MSKLYKSANASKNCLAKRNLTDEVEHDDKLWKVSGKTSSDRSVNWPQKWPSSSYSDVRRLCLLSTCDLYYLLLYQKWPISRESLVPLYFWCVSFGKNDYEKILRTKLRDWWNLFVLLLKTYSIYWTVMSKLRYKWNYLLYFSGNHIYRGDRQPTAYNRICNECIEQSLKNYIIIMFMEMLSFVGAFLGPFYAFIQNGSRATLYSVRLPFLHDNPNTEYIINVCWETFISLMGIVALFGMELMFVFINDTITVSSKLCESELNELSDQLESKRATYKESSQKLRIILMRTKFMDEWVCSILESKFSKSILIHFLQ